MDLISVVCDVRVPPDGIPGLLGQGKNQPLINIVGEIEEFEARHNNLVGFLCHVILDPQDITRDCTRFLIYAYQDSREIIISRELLSIVVIVAFVDEPEIYFAVLPDQDLICPKVLCESLVLKSEVLAFLFINSTEIKVRASQVIIYDVVHVILTAVVQHADLSGCIYTTQGDYRSVVLVNKGYLDIVNLDEFSVLYSNLRVYLEVLVQVHKSAICAV